VKGLLAFAAVLWVANVLARLSETQIQRVDQLTPSLRVLISKVLRVMFIVFAIVIGLNTVGIDLTSLAVFSGAVGVGLGFGLQKVVSNFISGIILLLDRSIKPGDVIAIEDTYGWVNKLSARHVSVITRDGKEHLIPNELLITERVENWSYSDRNIRLKIPVGISYDADPREALALMKEAAAECPRILKKPEPRALMIGFGDSSVDLELRCWISDPNNGVANIKSDVLLLIWDKLHEHGIEIPFPQRDVHIKSGGVA
jgi:small-conductance mechanosensitive channel